MLADGQALLTVAAYASGRPWVELGIGLDFGTADVGNVGSGEVKDFTAIGDVEERAGDRDGSSYRFRAASFPTRPQGRMRRHRRTPAIRS